MSTSSKKKKQDKMRWHFPSLDHGSSEGLSDPLLQYFEGNHEKYVAREAIQNSIDARLDREEPVKVVFERQAIASKKLAGGKELQERIKLCLNRPHGVNDKTRQFLEKAIAAASQPQIDVLRISDYNTVGLDGPDESHGKDTQGRWHRLVRAVGENEMTGVGGGSFGIGKGAPFAASLMRSVYYSTVSGSGEHIFQGKARLISHEHEGDKKRGEGFYGINGYESVREEQWIPEEFRRSERGTDVYIIGYDFGQRHWKRGLAKSVLENFWLAVLSGDLEVELRENSSVKLSINRGNLAEQLESLSRKDAYPYYLSVIAPTRKEEKQLPVLGSCQLYLRRNEGFPKRVAMMRKPKMVVRNKRFNLQDSFAGVFLCRDDEGNRILRDMEPPQHNAWDPELNSQHGRQAWSEIMGWIKETLRDMAGADSGSTEDIPGLDRFLPYDEDSDEEVHQGEASLESEGSTEEESGRQIGAERQEEEIEVQDIVQRPSAAKRGSGNEPGTTGPRGDEPVDTPGKRGGDKPGKSLTRINTSAIKFRTIASGPQEYCLVLDPLADQEGALNIIAVGDDSNYPLQLAGAEVWDSGNIVATDGSFLSRLKLQKGERAKIRLKLNAKHSYALGIESYEG